MRATIERGWKMRKTKVRRIEVLERVKANKEKHVAEYREAFVTYQEEMKDLVTQRKKDIEVALNAALGKVLVANVDKDKPVYMPHMGHLLSFTELAPPVSHEKDYEQVIQMLQMEVEDTVDLESDQFACFVMDDWDWKEEFRNTTEFYNSRKMSKG